VEAMDDDKLFDFDDELTSESAWLLRTVGKKYSRYAPDTLQKDAFKACPSQLIRFTNYAFNENYPLDATVDFKDTESSDPSSLTRTGDTVTRRGDLTYTLKYAIDGTDYELCFHAELETSYTTDVTYNNLTYTMHEMLKRATKFPDGSVNAIAPLMWQIVFFALKDQHIELTIQGHTVTFDVPTIQLPKLSIADAAKLHLFAAGVFFPRKYRNLKRADADTLLSEVDILWKALAAARADGELPADIADRLEKAMLFSAVYKFKNSKLPEGVINMATNQLSGYSPFVVEVASVLEGEYKKGEKKGEEKGIYKVVSIMLINHIPLPTIMTSTDLSEPEIRQFARQQGLTVTE
jgi:hypothetical protein